MIRGIGFLLILCCGGLWGEFFLAKRRRQIRDIQTGIRLVYFLVWELGNHPEQMVNLPAQLAVQGEWPGYLKGIPDYLDQLSVPETLPRGDRQRLQQCFSHLGHQEAAASLRELEQALHWLEELEQERREALGRDNRLYRPVGLCFGMVLGILLL